MNQKETLTRDRSSVLGDDSLLALQDLLQRSRPFLILSPPRSASTALARAILNHSQIGPYIHEPCDLFKHQQAGVGSVIDRLLEEGLREGALIKEMTFQLGCGALCEPFLANVRHPVAILIRHPRRALESRLRMVLKDLSSEETSPEEKHRIAEAITTKDYSSLDDLVGEEVFPLSFTGWTALDHQVAECRRLGIDYRIVAATDFRSQPRACLEPLLAAWDLEFEPAMVDWRGAESFQVSGLSEQSAWYQRVESSQRVLPEEGEPPSMERFPKRFRAHLNDSEAMYLRLLDDPHRLC